jgi:hypothetical protein
MKAIKQGRRQVYRLIGEGSDAVLKTSSREEKK